jgi:hypothetical protein
MSTSYKIDKLPRKDALTTGDYVIGVCDGIVTKVPRNQLRGPTGPKGPTGFAGLDGYIGQDGAAGLQGPAGTVIAGPAGDKGPVGDAGAAGTDGTEITVPEIITSDTYCMTFFEDEALGGSTWVTGKGWTSDGIATSGTVADKTEWRSPTITDRRIILPNTGGELVRAMPWAGKWNRIIAYVALRIDATSNFNGEWAFGVCSGTAQPFSSATCTNFFGVHSGATNTFTYAAQANVWLTDKFTGTGTVAAVSKVGNTITDSATAAPHVISAQEERLSLLGMSIWRPLFSGATAVTYSGRAYMPDDPNLINRASGNWNAYDAITGFYSDSTSVWRQVNGSTATLSHGEADGVLDTLNFWWEGGVPLEIAAIVVRKIY